MYCLYELAAIHMTQSLMSQVQLMRTLEFCLFGFVAIHRYICVTNQLIHSVDRFYFAFYLAFGVFDPTTAVTEMNNISFLSD